MKKLLFYTLCVTALFIVGCTGLDKKEIEAIELCLKDNKRDFQAHYEKSEKDTEIQYKARNLRIDGLINILERAKK